MTRHILDHPSAEENTSELKRFTDLERQKSPNAATTSLQQRSQDRTDSNARMRAYAQIERENR